jgi:hypothetical protein
MAEEKSPDAASVGVPGGGAMDTGAGKGVPSNACWVCGEPVGPTYVVMPVYRRKVFTEIKQGAPVPEPSLTEYVRLHHACHRAAAIMGRDA